MTEPTLTGQKLCAKCGAVLPANAPGGLCTACFFARMMSPPAAEGSPGLPATLNAGMSFAEYQLIEQIARGGMGVVWRAHHLSLNRTVAIKVIAAAELASPDFVARFRREAEAAASLDHPNIVPIYEIGEWNGLHFFSMKLIEGPTLAQKIAGAGPRLTDFRAAVQLLCPIARAVHYAHQRGILHRDLKPNNILLDTRGVPHLTDFGLAKLIEQESTVTRTVALLGTPSYMSPEQAAGNLKGVTTAADVYGLGAVMYELLTGQPPFAGGTTLETIRQVLDKEPRRPSLIQPRVDRDLETICLKCLEKEPSRRYGSAEALADDLERWLRGEPIVARPASLGERTMKWVRRRPQLAALLALAAIAPLAIILTLTVSNFRISAARRTIAHKAQESRHQLIRLNVASGVRAMDDGDWFAALLWCAEAMRLEDGDAINEEPHRYRIASVLREAPRLREMWFHEGAVNSAEFSPDGERVVTASADKTARVWNVMDSEAASLVLQHNGPVEQAVFSADSARVATISADETARVWDAVSGAPITPLIRLQGGGKQISFSPDGKTVLTPDGNAARIWDARTGQPAGSPFRHQSLVRCAAFSPDGRTVATGGDDNFARLWDAPTGEPLATAMEHELGVRDLWFSPDGRHLATVTMYDRVSVWDTATGELLAGPVRLLDHALKSSFSPDGARVLTAGFDTKAQVRDATTLKPLGPSIEHHDVVSAAQWSADGRRIVTASWDQTARVWDAATSKPISPILRHGGRVQAAVFNLDGSCVVTGDKRGVVRVWQLETNRATRLILRHAEPVDSAVFSPDGRRLLTSGWDNTARLWDAASGRPIGEPWPHPDWVRYGAFNAEGSRAVTWCRDLAARFWDLATQNELPELGRSNAVECVHFSPDGKRFVTASGDKTARVWDGATGEPVTPPLPHDGAVAFADFSQDGSRVLTAQVNGTAQVWEIATARWVGPPIKSNGGGFAQLSPDGRRLVVRNLGVPRPAQGDVGKAQATCSAQVWNVETGQAVTPPLLHEGPVSTVAFSPDGRFVATGSWDTTARIWDTSTGRPTTPPMRHNRLVYEVRFSADGRRLLVASGHAHARLWDAATGEPLTLPLKQDDQVVRASFSPDEREIVTAGSDGTARVFVVSRADEPVDDLVQLAQLLSAHRLDPAGGLVPLDNHSLSNLWQTLRGKYPARFRQTR